MPTTRTQLLEKLQRLDEQDPDALPIVSLDEYFSANNDEESIAPNQVGYGRPSLKELYARFQEIQAKPEVQAVMVGMHFDWVSALGDASIWPAAENIHIYTSAAHEVVEKWISGLEADGAIEGWTYGEHPAAPNPKLGYRVFSVCWD